MDILKRMFNLKPEEKQSKSIDKGETTPDKDEFRKPQWFEEVETDDELFDDDRKFAFQVFTNPMEIQKHFESQMQRLLESINDMEGNETPIDKNLKEEFLKPGFENNIIKEFEKQAKGLGDTDLDGEIYADQLHSLIQRLEPSDGGELPKILPPNARKIPGQVKTAKKKLTDEETILGKIHGTLIDEDNAVIRPRLQRPHPDMMTPMTPMIPPRGGAGGGTTFGGGAFDGTYQGPKMFSQSVLSKTIRKPDGTYETTKTTQDSQGNKTTTVTRTINGKTETITTYDNITGAGAIKQKNMQKPEIQEYSDRNIFVTKEGYAMPRNLW